MKKGPTLLAASVGFAMLSTSAHTAEVALTAAKTKWPECFCTDRYGKRRELGEIICLTVGDRSYMAKCVMAQNNPFWRDQNMGCLSSSLPKPYSPYSATVAALYE